MTPSTQATDVSSTVELPPSYNIPIILLLGAFGLVFVQPIVAGVVGLLGLFLMLQTGLIRLQFTDTDMDVYRGQTLIRRFPYREWENWRIFWHPVPILFYFKEVNSIHFLPILFNPGTLKACLEKYCPRK
ncbi:DUF3119 family protein [Calothrix sp. NIES-3974]|uniref:DUF3119 family protein n=1 Tax=Calothrix sp. NIES-3974 TaxID=2005462 RepID=UPI000B5FF5AA|nr:DUF3119 family protein [Calothrix sp. NIES-3974]BAZ06988.1 hypothetical protein NIES3974_36500 [Calothrix sp. NIES-3974]